MKLFIYKYLKFIYNFNKFIMGSSCSGKASNKDKPLNLNINF